MKETILGYEVDTISLDDCVDSVMASIKGSAGTKWLACINPHSFFTTLQDEKFAASLKDADWLIPDGVGIVMASKLLGGDLKKRLTGPDVFSSLLGKLNSTQGTRIFFMGSSENTLVLIRKRIETDYPNLIVAGTYSPPFKPVYSTDDINGMLSAINVSAVDVLWVGLTAPKQEKWIYENKDKLNVKFVGAVGAMFDYFAGINKPPSLFFQRLGLQWLHRLARNPRRMWRRTFISMPVFIYFIFREWLKRIKFN